MSTHAASHWHVCSPPGQYTVQPCAPEYDDHAASLLSAGLLRRAARSWRWLAVVGAWSWASRWQRQRHLPAGRECALPFVEVAQQVAGPLVARLTPTRSICVHRAPVTCVLCKPLGRTCAARRSPLDLYHFLLVCVQNRHCRPSSGLATHPSILNPARGVKLYEVVSHHPQHLPPTVPDARVWKNSVAKCGDVVFQVVICSLQFRCSKTLRNRIFLGHSDFPTSQLDFLPLGLDSDVAA